MHLRHESVITDKRLELFRDLRELCSSVALKVIRRLNASFNQLFWRKTPKFVPLCLKGWKNFFSVIPAIDVMAKSTLLS